MQHAHAFFSSAGAAVEGASRGSPGAEGAAKVAADDDVAQAEEEGPAPEDAPPLAPDEAGSGAAAFSADGGWG